MVFPKGLMSKPVVKNKFFNFLLKSILVLSSKALIVPHILAFITLGYLTFKHWMRETHSDRINMIMLFNKKESPPESVPINKLIKIPGTPLSNAPEVEPFDFVRTIALARILMPQAYVRLSAGREQMSDELQALCFMAGANSIFYGEKLLTANNPVPEKDNILFEKLGLKKLQVAPA